jgi:hypothetical protein
MMKIIFLTMAAIAGLTVTPSVAAQSWRGHEARTASLQMQLDEGIRSGAISRRDIPALRNGLRQLVNLERRFSPNGISNREGAILDQRGMEMRRQIVMAKRSGTSDVFANNGNDRRSDWEARYDREHRAAWDARYVSERSAQYENDFGRDRGMESDRRFDGPNRGDRFAGDVRVGQRFSSRMSSLPANYRNEYKDDASAYYGYDNERIYKVDRQTGIILGMLDLSN